jgi:hypothetical protein
MPARRFPPPWTVEDDGARLVVKDSNGPDNNVFVTVANR